MITNKATFTLCDTGISPIGIALSVFEGRLLFLHNSFTSSQFVLDKIGVMIMMQPTCTKLEISFLNAPEHSWGFFFMRDQHAALVRYFLGLGFKNCEVSKIQLVDNKARYDVRN